MATASRTPVRLVVAWVATLLTAGYLLPWAIAVTRGKASSTTIGVVTLLLGWTLVGWVVALIWSLRSDR